MEKRLIQRKVLPRALLRGSTTPIAGRRLQEVVRFVAVRRLFPDLLPEGAGGRTQLRRPYPHPLFRPLAGEEVAFGTDLHNTGRRMSSSGDFRYWRDTEG